MDKIKKVGKERKTKDNKKQKTSELYGKYRLNKVVEYKPKVVITKDKDKN